MDIYDLNILTKTLIIIFLIYLYLVVSRLFKKEGFKVLNDISVYDKLYDSFQLNYQIGKLRNHLKNKILEIGCSNGQLTNKLYRHGYQIEGVDNNDKNIEFCKKKYNLLFRHGDILEPMLYHLNSFQTILCLNLNIYKINSLSTFFQNCIDWLNPGGKLCIHMVNPSKLKNIFKSRYNLNGISTYHPKLTQISDTDFILKEYIMYDNHQYYYETSFTMYPISTILQFATQQGFIIESLLDINKYEKIYIFKKSI